MTAPTDEKHPVNALPGYDGVRMLALPLTGVPAPDDQRRNRTEP